MCKGLAVRENQECLGTDGNLQYMLRGKGGGQQREMRRQRNTKSLGLILRAMKNHWRVLHRSITHNINIKKQTKQNTH